MANRSALILSGTGRYSDPWHPFPETTSFLVDLLVGEEFEVRVGTEVDDELRGLIQPPDLLVVNAGLPRDGNPVPSGDAEEGLHRYLRSGRPLLAMHASATTFTDSEEWETALGGRWVRGVTMHPDQDDALIRVCRNELTEGLGDFVVNDERYSYLRVDPAVQVLATQSYEAVDHPIIWARERDGLRGRAAYDALGHDARSFGSAEHRTLLGRLVRWLGE